MVILLVIEVDITRQVFTSTSEIDKFRKKIESFVICTFSINLNYSLSNLVIKYSAELCRRSLFKWLPSGGAIKLVRANFECTWIRYPPQIPSATIICNSKSNNSNRRYSATTLSYALVFPSICQQIVKLFR